MFNFSANHLFLLSRTEYRSCAVFLMQDRDTQRVYRLYDFTKAQLIPPDMAHCIAGKVNSAGRLYLVIESVRPDTKHAAVIPMLLLMLTAREGRLSSRRQRFAHPANCRATPQIAARDRSRVPRRRCRRSPRRQNRRKRCSFKPALTTDHRHRWWPRVPGHLF